MTPDQIYMQLCDRNVLKTKGGRRVETVSPTTLTGTGLKARTADGTLVEGRITGKSMVQRVREQQAQAARATQGRRSRRGRKNGS